MSERIFRINLFDVAIIRILWRDPILILLTEEEPDAASQVHVKDQHEDGLDEVQRNLDIVSRRHIVDDLLEA